MLILLLIAADPTLTPVFLQKLAPDWQVSTWNKVTYQPRDRGYAVEMSEQWAGLAFDHRTAEWTAMPIGADEQQTLAFTFSGDDVALYLDNGSKKVRVKDYLKGDTARVPISALNSAKAPYSRIAFFGTTKHAAFYIADLRLEARPQEAKTISITIDVTQRQPVSPYIYGENATAGRSGMRFLRAGGNRWSTYNWQNNASNAGIDYGPNSNDGHLSDSNVAGEAVTRFLSIAKGQGAAALVTIPMLDVAADKSGPVTTPEGRFVPNSPELQAGLVALVEKRAPGTMYSLDNEPGLWASTHPLVHPHPATYAEMTEKSRAYVTMLRRKAPQALIFFGVCYGWNEMVNLQNAPDAGGRDYLDFLLAQKLGDVLDVHWYPEVKDGGKKVLDNKGASDARVQAPRSLWDPTYKEASWIKGPIRLLPLLRDKIAKHAPGTRLAITEYNYGGGDHITGGLAQADVLGIFAREGVFAAALWAHGYQEGVTDYVHAAFKMYAGLGDEIYAVTGVPAELASVYAFSHGLVLINKKNAPLTVKITGAPWKKGRRLLLDGQGKMPRDVGAVEAFKEEVLPPYSVTTLAL